MQFAIYKPNKAGSGYAFQFKYGSNTKKEPAMFIECVKQSSPMSTDRSSSTFNWKDDKLTVLLNVEELAYIASYIVGWHNGDPKNDNAVNFFHRNEGKNTTSIIKFNKPISEKEKRFGNWSIMITVKENESGKSQFVAGYITPSEVYRLKGFCDFIINEYNAYIRGKSQ